MRYSSKVQIRIDDLLIYVMPNYLLAIMSEKAHPEGRGWENKSFIHSLHPVTEEKEEDEGQTEGNVCC